MRRFTILFITLSSGFLAQSQVPNWSENIAPILYARCTNCHNVNGIAPFELMSYSDAVSYGSDIRSDVNSGIMPPWPPDAAYSHLAHERILTVQEKADIISWVDNGMPEGNPNLAPTPPVYTGIAQLTSPDLVSQIAPYTVNTTTDLYRCFVIPTNLATAKYITEIEAIPGNRNIVHHILIYEDSTSTPANLDAQDPGPGYTNFGGTGSLYSKLIGVWVPGSGLSTYPGGMGIKLPAHTNIILQIHYPGPTLNQIDSTQVRFKLSSGPLREISIAPVLNHYQLDNGPLVIPGNTTKTFTAHYTLTCDVSALAVGPHMHLIGHSISSWAISPASDTIPFISIPNWDFHWQGMYSFPRVLHLTTGTTIYSTAFYDNTSNNPDNPNNPPQLVTLGEATTDEMMLIYFAYTYYFPGDESIIQDSNLVLTSTPVINNDLVHSLQLYDPFPNPSAKGFEVSCFLPNASILNATLTNAQGKSVWNYNTGKSIVSGFTSIRVPALPGIKGAFFLVVDDGTTRRTKKILIE